MVTLARRAQRTPFAPVVATMFGVVAAILMAAVPQWLFEAAVVTSGLPTIVAAAAPPLGLVARLAAIVLIFAAVASACLVMLVPVARSFEARTRARRPWHDAGYDVASGEVRGDAAPLRRPIFAPDELGAPLMSDEAIAPAQAETDVFDEGNLAAPLGMDELEAVVRAPHYADDSIASLVRRLENGLARRAANDSDPDGAGSGVMPLSRSWIVPENVEAATVVEDDNSLRQALGTLRQMVRG